jgi:hypothetical protein
MFSMLSCSCTIVDRSNPMIAPRFESQLSRCLLSLLPTFVPCFQIRFGHSGKILLLIFGAPCSFSIHPAFGVPQVRRDRNLAERQRKPRVDKDSDPWTNLPSQKERWYNASDWLVQLSLVFVYKLRTNTLLTRVQLRHHCDHTIAITTSVLSAVSS